MGKTHQVVWAERAVREALENVRAAVLGEGGGPEQAYLINGKPVAWLDLACLMDAGRAFLGEESDTSLAQENARLCRINDRRYADRQLLLWLHAEAVHERDQLRAERDELQGHGVSRDIGEANERMRAELERERQIKAEIIDTNRLAIQSLRGELDLTRKAHETNNAAIAATNKEIAAERDDAIDALKRACTQRDDLRAELEALKAKTSTKWAWQTAPISDVMHLVPVGEGRREAVCGQTASTTWRDPVEGEPFCAQCTFGSSGPPDTEATEQAPLCGEAGSDPEGMCGESVPDGFCSEHGEVGPQPPTEHAEDPDEGDCTQCGAGVDEYCKPDCPASAEDVAREDAEQPVTPATPTEQAGPRKSCPECSSQPWRPHREDCPTLQLCQKCGHEHDGSCSVDCVVCPPCTSTFTVGGRTSRCALRGPHRESLHLNRIDKHDTVWDDAQADPATPTERAPIWQNPERWPKPCVHGILTEMMVCPVCEPEKQAEAEESARTHAARSQVGWTDPAAVTPTPRVWRKGDPEPPVDVQVLQDHTEDELPYLCRIPHLGGKWAWLESIDDPLWAPEATPWVEATAPLSRGIPLTEVVGDQAGGEQP